MFSEDSRMVRIRSLKTGGEVASAMIISHKHQFIFIKTRKTAGTSLEIALSKFLGPDDVVTPISTVDEQIRIDKGFVSPQNFKTPVLGLKFSDIRYLVRSAMHYRDQPEAHTLWPMRYFNHIAASEVRARLGHAVWDGYFTFSIDRNPWDLVVSAYYWSAARRGYMSFDDFVLRGGANLYSNFDLYCIDGVQGVDRIARYDTLAADLREISQRIGLPENLDDTMVEIRAKGSHRAKADYRDMYDERTKQAVAVQFGREIAMFGWAF